MGKIRCTHCPVTEAVRGLCKEVENAIPLLFAPPRHPCSNHALVETARDQLMSQLYRLRQSIVCVYIFDDKVEIEVED